MMYNCTGDLCVVICWSRRPPIFNCELQGDESNFYTSNTNHGYCTEENFGGENFLENHGNVGVGKNFLIMMRALYI